MGELKIFQVWTFSSLRMLSMSRIFPAPPFSDSDIWVENFLENTQKFYDGGAWMQTKRFLFKRMWLGFWWHIRYRVNKTYSDNNISGRYFTSQPGNHFTISLSCFLDHGPFHPKIDRFIFVTWVYHMCDRVTLVEKDTTLEPWYHFAISSPSTHDLQPFDLSINRFIFASWVVFMYSLLKG
jgi:hypothetical protein